MKQKKTKLRTFLHYLTALLFIILCSVIAGPFGFIISLAFIASTNTVKQKPVYHEPYTPTVQPTPSTHTSTLFTIPEEFYLQYREYLKSDTWSTLRYSTFKRDGFRCVRCGYLGDLKQAHHTHYNGIHTMSFTLDQLETVCHSCHQDIHKGLLPMSKD